jgi:uncharacterized protein YcbK (DUF882 family)
MLNFKISELIHSDTAISHNINNMPDINSLDCLVDLIFYVLQPLREKVGKAINITSGFRNAQVNKLVGGAVDEKGQPKSQHCKGQAADFTIKGMSVQAAIEFIKKSGIEYDQLINEYDKWVHISFVKGKNRKQYFKL